MTISAPFPRVFQKLWDPYRYKVLYGGRGGGRSWAVARWLLLEGIRDEKVPQFVLCCRELQKSISESVHRLLCDQIEILGLGEAYRIEKSRIVGYNGTEFVFSGLKNDPQALRSYEGLTRVWVEEAANVSRTSWDSLVPTVRRPGSQIIMTLNPMLETDTTLQRFIYNPPPDTLQIKTTYRDNEFFPDVLRAEMRHMRATDIDLYNHVYEGAPINFFASSVYAAELRQVDKEDRITRVPYDPSQPVDCFYDLGFHDKTAIWMVQSFPFEYRCIDYIEGSGKTIHDYLVDLKSRGYNYRYDYIPWDVGMHATQMGSGKSIEELMRLAGRQVRIVPRMPSKADGINAARTIFPLCWFDRERCADGLQALRHYRYEVSEKSGQPARQPLHDASSHGADAFAHLALMVRPPRRPPPPASDSGRVMATAWS
jgi:phage terminase large subunit